MKKIITIAFVAMMALSVAACNNNNNTESTPESSTQSSVTESSTADSDVESSEEKTESKTESSNEESKEESKEEASEESTEESSDMLSEMGIDESKLGEKTKKDILDVFKNGAATMVISAEGEVSGTTQKGTVTVVKDADNNFAFSIDANETSVKIIKNSEGTYMLNDAAKMAIQMPESSDTSGLGETGLSTVTSLVGGNSFVSTDKSEFTYEGDGKENVNGKELDFEKYKTDSAAITFYFDGDKPVLIKAEQEATDDESASTRTLNIDKFSAEADSSMFTIPEDYTVQSIADAMGLNSNASADEDE